MQSNKPIKAFAVSTTRPLSILDILTNKPEEKITAHDTKSQPSISANTTVDLEVQPEYFLQYIYDEMILQRLVPSALVERCIPTYVLPINEAESEELKRYFVFTEELTDETHLAMPTENLNLTPNAHPQPIPIVAATPDLRAINDFPTKLKYRLQTDEGIAAVAPFIKKILNSKFVAYYMQRLEDLNFFNVLFPELQCIKDFYGSNNTDLKNYNEYSETAVADSKGQAKIILTHAPLQNIWLEKIVQPIQKLINHENIYEKVCAIFKAALESRPLLGATQPAKFHDTLIAKIKRMEEMAEKQKSLAHVQTLTGWSLFSNQPPASQHGNAAQTAGHPTQKLDTH